MSQYFGILYSINGLMTIFYIIPSVFFACWAHGIANAYAIKKLACYPKHSDGRVSLNPFRYIDIIGFMLMCVSGYGWCRTLEVEQKHLTKPQKIILLLSGPIGNVILALIALLLQTGIMVIALVENTQTAFFVDMVLYFLNILIYTNILMLVLHILPIPGFNGYNILKTLFFENYYSKRLAWLEANGKWIAVILAMAGLLYYCAELPTIYAYRTLTAVQEWLADLVTGGLFTGSSWKSK